ncbi:unnamed protein product [Alopecurus aequalis]
MLRLRSCVVSRLLSPLSTYPVSHLHRLLSAAAPPASPSPPISPIQGFAIEDYLIDTCGLTRAQALKASPKLSHLKSPSKPDAVLAFLAGLGLSSADVAAVVARDPHFLCAKVDKTLAPAVVGLTGLGISNPEIARLVPIAPERFRCRSIVSKLKYYLPLLGSFDNILMSVQRNYHLLTANLETTVKPNVLFLQECGLCDRDIAKLCIHVRAILTAKPECVRAMVARAEGIGVPCGSGMFREALSAVAFLSEEYIAAKVDYLKKTFRWSDAQVSIALVKGPVLLKRSKDMLQRKSEFLISEVGLEPAYIAHRPVIIGYSMEGRLRPRYYVLKFLKANGFVDQKQGYYDIVSVSEEVFVKKFICPHKEATPHLADDYAAACKGEVPTNFRFT